MAKISVLGSGSWGLALALLLHNNGHEVLLWSARPENARKLREKRENPDRLPGVRLPDEIDVLTDLERALKDVDVTVLAVASPYIRSTAHKMASFVCRDQKIVNVAKGIEEKTLKTLSEVIEEEIPQGNVAVLSGPSHAEEVGRGLPTTCVISAHTQETAEYLQSIFMSPVFRVYTTPDILGVELGGALKNVIALAAGTADGLGYGDNTKAALITSTTIPSFSSQVRFRLILAGLPMNREPSGITVFLVTRLPAPMIQSFPIFAPSRITAPIPISVRSPMVHPWITALCPTVTLFPIWTGMLWLT